MTVCQAEHFNHTAENFRISREEFKYHLDMYPSDTLLRLRSRKKCYLKAIDTHPFACRRGIAMFHTKSRRPPLAQTARKSRSEVERLLLLVDVSLLLFFPNDRRTTSGGLSNGR